MGNIVPLQRIHIHPTPLVQLDAELATKKDILDSVRLQKRADAILVEVRYMPAVRGGADIRHGSDVMLLEQRKESIQRMV